MGPADKNHSGDDEALKKRLDTLAKALDVKRQDTEETTRANDKRSNSGIGNAMGIGFRVASELAASIMVSGFLGWQIDKWLGTDPWFLLGFLFLGIVAGFWSVYKLAARPTGDGRPPV